MPRRSREAEVAPSISQEMRSMLDDYRADFDIGGTGRYLPAPKGIRVQGSGADYHYRDETRFFRGIERARFYDRNNMIAGQGVDRLTDNLVQDGFTLDPQSSDKGFNKEAKAKFWDWADDPDQCDLEQEKTFGDMEWMALRAVPVDGDILSILREEGCLQWVEAHRLRRPRSLKRNNVHGIDLDPATGRRTGFTIAKEDVDPLRSIATLKEVDEVKARDDEGYKQVLQLYWPKRFSQRRGVTAFAPIVFPLNYHDDLQFAKLVQAQQCSIWAIIEEQGEFALPQPGGDKPMTTGSETLEVLEDGTTRTVQGASPGMRVRLPKGVKAQGFSPNVPNQEFFEHAHLILSIIAVNLGLPVHVLMLDPSKTNFSGWRGAIDQARITFRKVQRHFIRRFHAPVYRWRLRQWAAEDPAVAKRLASNPKDFFAHAWHPPTWAYIEPNKDISANSLELATLQTSPRRQRSRQGDEFDEILPEFIADAGSVLEQAEAKAQELNKRLNPEKPFTRDEILRVFTAKGVTVSATQADEAAEEEPVAPPKTESASK